MVNTLSAIIKILNCFNNEKANPKVCINDSSVSFLTFHNALCVLLQLLLLFLQVKEQILPYYVIF